MSQATAKGASPEAPPKTSRKDRPLSPHLQVWRWHITMWGSILHRVSGVGLYVGTIAVVAWLAALALGRDAYTHWLTYAAHPLALIVWIGLALCAFYHLAAGLRHLIWDTGAGLSPKSANALVNFSIWFALIATALYWAYLFISGKVSV
ncbi:MAG TPA: succinate dehydrogenase, cytochrome b556 subunit [Caulobacteraceae bacterium]|jgi:succinate dehydrogenase / fumarate reductase cytochrome b subunit|nr:succinate dehydrogenase, cytochrome b556 subunit [Caulobacteraceae bacterium]